MKRTLFAIFGTGALAAVILLAQTTNQPTPPTVAQQVAQRVAQLTTLLDLTTGQQNSATAIFTVEITALSTIDTNQQTAETALKTAITANSAPGIVTAASTIGSLAAQQAQAEGTGEAAFYALLTTTQQAKYDVLGDNKGPGAPGGPGGPHGPPGATGGSGGGHH